MFLFRLSELCQCVHRVVRTIWAHILLFDTFTPGVINRRHLNGRTDRRTVALHIFNAGEFTVAYSCIGAARRRGKRDSDNYYTAESSEDAGDLVPDNG